MAFLLFKVRRYRVLILFSALVIALWYRFSPPDHDGAFAPNDAWLQPSHNRGTTKEKVKAEWSQPEPDDAMPPGKGNPHGNPHDLQSDEPDPADLDIPTLTPTLFVPEETLAPKEEEHEVEAAPIPTQHSSFEGPDVPIRPPSMHEHPRIPYIDPAVLAANHFPSPESNYAERPHWRKMPEHFPVAKEDMIKLPRGNPKSLPKIQFDFETGSESSALRNERLERQGAVKDAFRHAWEGYSKYAWGHDEVMPISGGVKDPFAGWAATLVDALDTMSIMGLHEEFEKALKEVAKIDFTITMRDDIPMFETTIRYLGGLIGAYDVSGQKHQGLIDKAEELAEILYNAFDTPNRMPVLYFQWSPDEVAKKHRAGRSACMAELGSLSVEFTRLAQITGKDKYFDAIQRITNEFDIFLNKTSLPGFWPLTLDASGCEQVDEPFTITTTVWERATPKPKPRPTAFEPTYDPPVARENTGLSPAEAATQEKIAKSLKSQSERSSNDESEPKVELDSVETDFQLPKFERAKRALEDAPAEDVASLPTKATRDSHLKAELDKMEKDVLPPQSGDDVFVTPPRLPSKSTFEEPEEPEGSLVPVVRELVEIESKCLPSGFRLNGGENKYSYGGMSDSTYEYLLKEYILLGGLEEQYKKLYITTYETGRDNLFFKPMTPKMDDILVSGDMQVTFDYDKNRYAKKHIGTGSHLTCFVGGMVGMGAKIFERPDDLKLAIKLTEGCVWNYFSTATGIMPEGFNMAVCPKTETCKWDEWKWKSLLIGPGIDAIRAAKDHGITLTNPYHDHQYLGEIMKRGVGYSGTGDEKGSGVGYDGAGGKQVGGGDSREPEEEPAPPPLPPTRLNTADSLDLDHRTGREDYAVDDDLPTRTMEEEQREKAEERDAFEKWQDGVTQHLSYSNIPEGYSSINDPRYILRPEAIESVFYMYRITGDRTWQDKGWKMFQAVEKWTKTPIAHSAISDVTNGENPVQLDSMESFWLAETLKYFYLLFSEPDLVSLDEFVLNTEAHPLLRPKPKSSHQ